MEKARNMKSDSGAPKGFWFEMVNMTNYLVNRTSTKTNS
jgi:hypothetical protein